MDTLAPHVLWIGIAKGTECKLMECSHNDDRECGIDSACEPLLDWMSFSGYCPDYDGKSSWP